MRNADGTTEPFPYLVWTARRAAVKRYRFLQRNGHPVDRASNAKKKKKKKKLARVNRAIGGDGKSTIRKRKRAEDENKGGDHDGVDDDEAEAEEEEKDDDEEEEEEEMRTVWVDAKPEDHNTDACCVCSGVGDLLCCDFCPRAFHLKCIGVLAGVMVGTVMWMC